MKYAIILAIALLITGCTTTGHVTKEPVKIGVISIMSGDFAVVGEQVRRSIELTLQDIPDAHNYEFIFEDGQCDKQLSISAARKLIDVDQVKTIIAAGCSDTTIAIAPIANEEHIVVLMPSTGGENIDNAGEYIFRNGNSDILAATQPAQDFIDLGYSSVALISDQTEAMEDIRKHFKEAYNALGGSIILDETVQPSEKDFRTIIAKINRHKPDVIFINSQTGITGAYFIKQYDQLGNNLPIMTNFNTATNTQTYKIAGQAMENVQFYDPDYNQDDKRVQKFLEAYEEKYGGQPPLLFHSIATRDAMYMLIQAYQSVGDDGERIHDWLLENIDEWDGYMGRITFDEKGNANSGYARKEIHEGEFVLLE